MFPPLRFREAMSLGGLTTRELIVRTWSKLGEHEIFTRSSAVAFYAMAATVPFLGLILFLVVQILPDVTGTTGSKGIGDLTVAQFRTTLDSLFPREAAEMIHEQIARIQKAPPVGLLSLGLVISLWTASSLFMAIIDAMNVIYGVKESRPYWKLRLTAVAMTLVQAGMLVGSLLAIVAGPWLMQRFGLGSGTAWVATILQWLFLEVMVLLSFALSFYIGPDARQSWEWISPGSLAGSLIFLAFCLVFRLYIQHFADYDKAYGSLGGVMVLLFWLWVSSVVLLTAAQMNKVIEDASPLGKGFGQKVDPTESLDLRAIRPEPSTR